MNYKKEEGSILSGVIILLIFVFVVWLGLGAALFSGGDDPSGGSGGSDGSVLEKLKGTEVAPGLIRDELNLLRVVSEIEYDFLTGYAGLEQSEKVVPIVGRIADLGGELTVRSSVEEYVGYSPVGEGYLCIDSSLGPVKSVSIAPAFNVFSCP